MFPPGSAPAGTPHEGHRVLLGASPLEGHGPPAPLARSRASWRLACPCERCLRIPSSGGKASGLEITVPRQPLETPHMAPRFSSAGPPFLAQTSPHQLPHTWPICAQRKYHKFFGQTDANVAAMLFCSAANTARPPSRPFDIPWLETPLSLPRQHTHIPSSPRNPAVFVSHCLYKCLFLAPRCLPETSALHPPHLTRPPPPSPPTERTPMNTQPGSHPRLLQRARQHISLQPPRQMSCNVSAT